MRLLPTNPARRILAPAGDASADAMVIDDLVRRLDRMSEEEMRRAEVYLRTRARRPWWRRLLGEWRAAAH